MPIWTHSKNSVAAEAPSLNIFPLGHDKYCPNQHKNSHKLYNEKEHLL